MPRKKLTYRKLEKVELRSAGMKAIDPELSFGDSRNLANMLNLIEQMRNKIDDYNTALSVIDSSKTEIAMLEKTLSNLSEEMLIGVAFRYGKDSREYEMAGGVRKSDRVRRSATRRIKASAENQSNENSLTA